MTDGLNNSFYELDLDEIQAIDGGGFYEVFMRGAELLFVGTTTAAGASAGGVLGGALGAIVGEVAWEYMFGDSFSGNLLKR